MHCVYSRITEAARTGKKLFALLVDPDKVSDHRLSGLCKKAMQCNTDFILTGGSFISNGRFGGCVKTIKESCNIPVVIFPGSTMQIDKRADALLLLSLISGRNADLLIGKHVTAAPLLKRLKSEIIPTGYMVVESGKLTSVQYISGTLPLPHNKPDLAAHTALAGELLGMKLIYMDAGSGAEKPVRPEMISAVKNEISVPLIVGGGINSPLKVRAALKAGADMVVIGNSIERKPDLIFKMAESAHSFK